jgi:hypothetical protein
LPGIGIKTRFHDVHKGENFGIEITLADDAALALFQVRWAPWRVQVVHGQGACLHVHAGTHLFRGPDQYPDAAFAYGVKQLGTFGRTFSIMDEGDL